MTDTNDSPKWEFKSRTIYEFTINLNDDYQMPKRGDPATRALRAHSVMSEVLATMGPGVKYNLRYELSMPQYGDRHKNPFSRIHWHGIIYFSDDRTLYEFLLTGTYSLTRIGRYQFNSFRPQHWEAYCKKHKSIFKDRLKIRNASFKVILSLNSRDESSSSETESFDE